MTFIHKELSAGKWFEMSLLEQMANIGSEVYRTIQAFRGKNEERFHKALDRAIELFDLTLSDSRWKGRRKEICRSREVFCALLFDSDKIVNLDKELDSIDNYFLQFAIAARHQKSNEEKINKR